ncbi:MAG: DUF805 domain-containing protein [Phenylobacterium sp.]|uniref:DUF805 domain-containing protein n=1 Tax=Brevundimonas sp. TaxID=1871086 RepID=UPI002737BDD9|nr:DUF805 domain-containing protein [Brevundimonas sp.]MDP3801335.1 DUF805 domain-containing protein [Brevundimonas sp.]MDZ4371629.1 DUF805 domain-containing protein [Phenylobacterium sp.]
MRGEVINLDGISGDGLISGDDGARYTFTAGSSRSSLRVGEKVDFVGTDGVATDIMSLGGAPASFAGQGYATAPSTAGYDFGWALFSFEGRLRRSHFWISWVILFFGGFVVGLIPFIGQLIGLILIWPNIAIQVKRLHDMGKTGWWVLAPFAANIVGIVLIVVTMGMSAVMNAEALEREDPAAVLAMMGPMLGIVGLLILINLGFLLWIGIVDTQPGRNQYGRNPKFPVDDTADTFA